MRAVARLRQANPAHLAVADLIVGGEVVGDCHARTVRVQVVGHVVLLLFHHLAHLVEARGRDHVATAVDLPGNGSKPRADFVVTRGASGRAGVHRHVNAKVLVDNHAFHEVVVVVTLVIDNGVDLRLDTNILVRVERREDVDDTIVAEDAVVKGRLVLPLGAACASRGVRPVDLVGLANMHVFAVLPVVRRRELGVGLVVKVAAVPQALVVTVARRAFAALIILACGEVLGTEVPVHVDGAKVSLVVPLSDGNAPLARVHPAFVAGGHVGAGLLENRNNAVLHALDVRKVLVAWAGVVRLLPLARVDVRVDGGRLIELADACCDTHGSDDTENHPDEKGEHRGSDLPLGRDEAGIGRGEEELSDKGGHR
mmetsp:Transcript_7274/g.14108  ORF Transcript_7274/g.14108 Transcript_7274/m.14108 type:complete len:369 (+) Transcript_7274:207-1313(+)